MTFIPAWNFPDQLARMPIAAQRKFGRLAAELEDVQALLSNILDREKRVEARAYNLNRSRASALRDGDSAQAERLASECDAAQTDYGELVESRARLNAKHAELSNLTSRLQHNEIPNIYAGVVAIEIDAQPLEGEDFIQAITRVRAEISSKRGTIAWVRQLPLPREELLAMARTAVNDLALGGQPLVVTEAGKFSIQWDRVSVPGYPAASDNYVPRMFAALFPEETYQLLVRQIPDRRGFSANVRRRREAALQREILQLEHQEEALITMAQAQGLTVPRRRDASAFALLGVCPHHMMQPEPQLPPPEPDEPDDGEAPIAEAAE